MDRSRDCFACNKSTIPSLAISLVLVVMIKSKELKTKISHTHSLILSRNMANTAPPPCLYTLTITRSHTLLITCTCCYDEIKGTQDQDLYSYSFSDSLSQYAAHTHVQDGRWMNSEQQFAPSQQTSQVRTSAAASSGSVLASFLLLLSPS